MHQHLLTLNPTAPKIYWFPQAVPHMCPHFSDSSTRWPPSEQLFHHTDFLWTDQTFCVHRHARKVLKTYSESSFPDGSKDTNFRSLGLSWAEQLSSFKVKKKMIQVVSTGFWCPNKQIVSVSSNDDSSDQNRPRVLKLLTLELLEMRIMNMSSKLF
jgi:hypothetical protein